MPIRIKNLQTGRLIIVKNQDDMDNLKNTGQSYGFGVEREKKEKEDPGNGFELERLGDRDREDYINTFSYDEDETGDSAPQIPKNPTRDPYYNFADDKDQDDTDDQSSDNFDIFGGMDDANDDMSQVGPGENPDDFDMMGSDEEPKEDEQSNYQGEIRSVTGARLEYKRQNADGTFNELWVYTIGKDAQSEFAIRRAILSGTDIDPNTNESDDGTQKAETVSIGNVQFINISGLPQ